MCCEDVQIDKEKKADVTVLALTNASIELIGADPHRVGLLIGGPVSGTAWAVPDQAAVVGSGFQLAAGLPPLKLTQHEVGDLVRKAWFVIHTAGGVNLTVAEILHLPGGVCDGKKGY